MRLILQTQVVLLNTGLKDVDQIGLEWVKDETDKQGAREPFLPW